MSKRQRFSSQFKRAAVRRLAQSEKPVLEIVLALGIGRNQLYTWRDEVNVKGGWAFQGPGRRPLDQESALSRLRRELTTVKEERATLKKAAQYFARELM